MFQIKAVSSFKWPVKVQVPTDGRHIEQKFTAEFKYVPQERIDEIRKGEGDDEGFLKEVLIGWDGIVDEKKDAVPYSDEAKAELLRIPYVRTALVAAFFEGIAGRKAKN